MKNKIKFLFVLIVISIFMISCGKSIENISVDELNRKVQAKLDEVKKVEFDIEAEFIENELKFNMKADYQNGIRYATLEMSNQKQERYIKQESDESLSVYTKNPTTNQWEKNTISKELLEKENIFVKIDIKEIIKIFRMYGPKTTKSAKEYYKDGKFVIKNSLTKEQFEKLPNESKELILDFPLGDNFNLDFEEVIDAENFMVKDIKLFINSNGQIPVKLEVKDIDIFDESISLPKEVLPKKESN